MWGGGGGGAIFEPKTLSMYSKKKKKSKKKSTERDLNPRPPGLKSTRLNTIIYHSIDSLYSTNSVNVYVPSDNQQFRYKIARGW